MRAIRQLAGAVEVARYDIEIRDAVPVREQLGAFVQGEDDSIRAFGENRLRPTDLTPIAAGDRERAPDLVMSMERDDPLTGRRYQAEADPGISNRPLDVELDRERCLIARLDDISDAVRRRDFDARGSDPVDVARFGRR